MQHVACHPLCKQQLIASAKLSECLKNIQILIKEVEIEVLADDDD